MSKFWVQIETDNAAFEGDECAPEVCRILRKLAGQIEGGAGEQTPDGIELFLYDLNGNRVGTAEFVEGVEG